jgi:hypothetical protein
MITLVLNMYLSIYDILSVTIEDAILDFNIVSSIKIKF